MTLGTLCTCFGVLLVLILELGIFNLAHWQSLGAGGDNQVPVEKTEVRLGPGLERIRGERLEVKDPSTAWIQVPTATNKATFVRVEPGKAIEDSPGEEVLRSFHIRLDAKYSPPVGWVRGSSSLVTRDLTRSQYVRNRAQPGENPRPIEGIRLWIQEPKGTCLEMPSITPDVRVPLDISLIRLGTMAVAILLIAAFLPTSRLWNIPLDTGSARQGTALGLLLLPLLAWSVWTITHDISTFVPGDFHQPNSYVYDFNQYDQVAQSLLRGQPWLDLNQPPELSKVQNPYDIATRNKLLAENQYPIYWDYAYYKGHWYSYFGVLPVLLLFIPYRLLTSLFHPGGYPLPTSAAAAFLVALATLMTALVVIRLLARYFPGLSLATTGLSLITALSGSNLVYLWCRKNFYTVPFSASILALMTGLWFWLGARRVRRNDSTRPGQTGASRTRMWTLADQGRWDQGRKTGSSDWSLSTWRIFLGSVCISSTLGCRPTFLAGGLLAIPIFSEEIRSIIKSIIPVRKTAATSTRPSPRTTLRILSAALLPLCILALLQLWYNHWRFGSALDFGNKYQMTALDLTHYQPDLASLPQIVGYYLVQPPTSLGIFPFFQIAPAPMRVWHFSEPGVGGLLITVPVLLVSLLILIGSRRIRKDLKTRKLNGMIILSLLLALLIMTIDAYLGGFSSRYTIDFAWLPSLVAVMVLGSWESQCTSRQETISTGKAGKKDRAIHIVSIVILLSCLISVIFLLAYGLVLLSLFDSDLFITIRTCFLLV